MARKIGLGSRGRMIRTLDRKIAEAQTAIAKIQQLPPPVSTRWQMTEIASYENRIALYQQARRNQVIKIGR